VLGKAKARGFLGPGPVGAQIEHSFTFTSLLPAAPRRAVDLGSGGGVPGLVLALLCPRSRWILIDAGARRAAFLREAVGELELSDRVEVLDQRAEDAGRNSQRRGEADLVVARSFGPPAVTAECAAPFLRTGGFLVVAEPPGGAPERWPARPLALLGLIPDKSRTAPVALQRLRQAHPCPPRYPRRPGIPAKRPLY
jgi:16S rRNA (guanine527-N7)-methyltransferase